MPEVLRHFSERLGSLALPLPSLRSRSDEIPSLSSLYLNSLNLELGKQPRASSPGPSRCSASTLAQQLHPVQERPARPRRPCRTAPTSGPGRWPICFPKSGPCGPCRSQLLPASPVSRPSKRSSAMSSSTVAAHGGNRAAAARQLGISRTTLWRYMEKIEQKQQNVEKSLESTKSSGFRTKAGAFLCFYTPE